MHFAKFLAKLSAAIVVSFSTLTLCILGLSLFLALLAGAMVAASGTDSQNYDTVFGSKDSSNELLSVKVSGVITGEQDNPADIFGTISTGSVGGYDIKQQLSDAAKNPDIKGVVMEVDSPGGTIFGARAIEQGVEYYKAVTHKPVYTFVSGLAASGGYMASVASDAIFADYGSSIGSIGVIFGPFEYYDKVLSEDNGLLGGGVVTQNGISQIYFTAGKYKDFGNPYRKLTQDEIDNAQKSVNNEYADFVNLVSQKRHIAIDTIINNYGALIFDNKTAQSNHLIDATLNREQTYTLLAKKAGIDINDFKVVRSKSQPSLVSALIGSLYHGSTPQVATLCNLNSFVLAYHGDITSLCQ